MKRFFKLGNFGSSNSSKKKESKQLGTENEKPVPLSRLSSLSDSSSGWGSIANFNAENEKYYRNDSFNAKEFTKLHQACWLGNMEKVKKHSKVIAIDQVDHFKRTPLHLACAQAHKDVVLFLINSKANLDEKDSQGNSPLFVAILHRHQDICNILLDKGVNFNELNLEGDTALHLACKNGLQDVIVSLASKRVDIDATNKVGSTPLFVATSQRQLEIVKLLLRLGADVNIPSQNQKTCLMVACEEGFEEMVQIFLHQQANVSAENAEGFTAEDLARSADNYECVELLQKYSSFQVDSNRTNFTIQSSNIHEPTSTTSAHAPDNFKEKESDSDSWNDDYSDDLPASQPKKVFSPIKIPMLAHDFQISDDKPTRINSEVESTENLDLDSGKNNVLESSSQNILMENFETNTFKKNIKLNSENEEKLESSKQILTNNSEPIVFKENIEIYSENDEILKSSSQTLIENSQPNKPLPVEPEIELAKPPTLQSSKLKLENRDLLSELGLSDVSEPSSSIKNSFASKNNDLPDVNNLKISSKENDSSINENKKDGGLSESEVDPSLSYVDTDEESIIEEDDKGGALEPREEGTLGRIDTMHQVDELWEKNSVVALTDPPSPEEEDNLYHARLAIINSKASTMERDDNKDFENMNAGGGEEEIDGELLWNEMMKILFEKLNEDNDESSFSGSCLMADEECKESSSKDLTFQEISSADDQSNISICEDRPYVILSEILRDSAYNEKILDLFQRLRMAWLKDHSRCRSFKQTISVLKTQSTKVKPTLEALKSERLESENKCNQMEFQLESLKQALQDEENKRQEMEFHLEKSKEKLDKLEGNYLEEVNLRQSAQVALKSSQEELRSNNEIFDELKNEKSAKDEMEEKCTQTIDDVDTINDFNQKLKDLLEENQNLSNKLHLEEKSRLKFEEENKCCANKLNGLETKLNSEMLEKDSLKRDLQMNASIKETITNKEAEIVGLNKNLQLIENENLDLNCKLKSLQEKYELTISEKEMEKTSGEQALQSINQQLTILQTKFNALQTEYDSSKRDLEKTIKLNETLEESIKTSTNTPELESKEQLQKVIDENNNLQNKLNLEKKSCLQFSEEKKCLENQLYELQNSLKNQKLIEDEHRRDLRLASSTTETVKIKEKEIEELNEKIKFGNKEKLVLKNELNSQKEIYEELKSEFETLKNSDEQLTLLSNQMTSLQDRFNSLQKTYNCCKDDLESAKRHNQTSEESQNKLKLQYDSMYELMQIRYQELSKEMMESREKTFQEKEKLLTDVSEFRIEKSGLESELKRFRIENAKISEMLSITENTLQETKLANFASENNLKSLQREIQFLSQQNKQLMEDEKSFHDEIYSSKMEMQRLQIANDQLTSQVAKENKSNKKFTTELEKLKFEKEKFEKDCHLYLAKNKELNVQLENLKIEFEDERAESSNKCKKADDELKKMQSELRATEEEVQYLTQKINLNEENKKLKKPVFPNKSTLWKKCDCQNQSSEFYQQPQTAENTIYEKENEEDWHSGSQLYDMMQKIVQEMRNERKRAETPQNPNLIGANDGTGSDFVRKTDLEMLKLNYEIQYFVEINKKLEQINVFLQGRSNTSGFLEQTQRRHQNGYEEVIQSLQNDISKYQRSSLEKDRRNNELEEQYEHLKQLIKIKKRIKRKLVNETNYIPRNNQGFQMEDFTVFRSNQLSHLDQSTDPLKTWVKMNL